MKKKPHSKKRGFPVIKKEIKDFLLDEEGKISKKDIVKMGISLAVLGTVLHPQDTYAGYSHTDGLNPHGSHFATVKHSSYQSHSEHGSHSNHSSGGWGC